MDAEKYYVTMIKGDDESWNVRDRHMQDTLERLADFYGGCIDRSIETLFALIINVLTYKPYRLVIIIPRHRPQLQGHRVGA